MITLWTSHLKTDLEKDQFKKQFRNAHDILNRLEDILKQKLIQLDNEEKDFSAGWEFKMASIVGRRAEINDLLKLLNRDQGAKQ